MSTSRIDCLRQCSEKLTKEVNNRLKTNLTVGGKSILYSIAYWNYRLAFLEEFKFDKCLFDYLVYLLHDVRNLLVDYSTLEEILDEMRFYYDENNYQFMN